MDGPSILVQLLIVFAIAAVVLICAVRGARGSMRMGPVAVLLIGGGLNWLYLPVRLLLYSLIGGLTGFNPPSILEVLTAHPEQKIFQWIVSGAFWVLLYYLVRGLRPDSWGRRIIAFLIAAVGSSAYGLGVYGLERLAESQWNIYGLSGSGLRIEWQFTTLGQYLVFVELFAVVIFKLWLVSRWLEISEQGGRRIGPIYDSGLKGAIMSKLQNQSTRLLCASVLFNGGARRKLLSWLKDKNRAVALELGVDLELVAQVARFAERRSRQGWMIYLAIFCLSALGVLLTPIALFIGVIPAAIVWFIRYRKEKDTFPSMFWTENFDPEKTRQYFAAKLEADDLDALPSADQNFFAFEGFSPFVGAGEDLGGWSVVIALDKPRMDFGAPAQILPFHVKEIYDAIDLGLDDLKVPDIEKRDTFFARGSDLRGDHDLLPDIYGRPVQYLPPRVTVNYIYRDDEKVRHYRCYRILDWGGELALSYYLRCSCRGNTLFVETKRWILTPFKPEYRKVDSMVSMDTSEMISSAIGAIIIGPVMAVLSPIWGFFKGLEKIGELLPNHEEHKRHEMIERSPLFNYGAVTSLRQSLSSGEYGHYFQKMDGDLYNKLFEHEVLDSLVEFLDAHGVDTSELKERQTTILNTGVMVQGGDVKAESLAVGAGARALKTMKGLVTAPAAKGSAS